METIILASGSPRRLEYFKLMGLPFEVLKTEIDETLTKQTDPQKLTAELAVKKAENAINIMKANLPAWIFTADTVVALDGKIFGKPTDREDAAGMLRAFSGREHVVFTSIALFNREKNAIDCRTASCSVVFAELSDKEIEWYLNTNEWQGVAGAYRIQGLASCFITKIKGCQSTVTGLPLNEFYVILKDNGYRYGACAPGC